MNLSELYVKVKSTLDLAKNDEVDQFIESHIELEQELFYCMKALTDTINATETLSSMKFKIVSANLITLLIASLFFSGLYTGINFIEHNTVNYGLTILVSAFLGWYIWEKTKYSVPVFLSLREINKHEKNLMKNMSMYILAGEVLKNYHTVGTSIVSKFIEEGKYSMDEPEDAVTEES